MRAALRNIILNKQVKPVFELALKTSGVPEKAVSGTPTLTRSYTATVMGYLEAANSGATQTLLTIPAGIARFAGARFIASNNTWSNTFADGTIIPEATLKGGSFENSRINLLLGSEEFDNARWIKNTGTITVNQTTSPSGTLTADLYTLSGDPFRIVLDYAGTNATYTESIYVKAVSGTFNVTLRLKNRASDIIVGTNTVSVNSDSWTRVSSTGTTDGGNSGVRFDLLVGNNNVYIWGAQLEEGAFASSYIPTTTAAVTRAADILSYPTAGNLNAAAGAIYLEFTPEHAPSGTIFLFGSYVDSDNYTAILHNATSLIARKRIAGTNYDATIANAFVSGTAYKIAVTWGSSGLNIAVAGVLGTANSNSTAAQLGTTIQIGADGNSLQHCFGELKNIKFYTKQLKASKLITLTL